MPSAEVESLIRDARALVRRGAASEAGASVAAAGVRVEAEAALVAGDPLRAAGRYVVAGREELSPEVVLGLCAALEALGEAPAAAALLRAYAAHTTSTRLDGLQGALSRAGALCTGLGLPTDGGDVGAQLSPMPVLSLRCREDADPTRARRARLFARLARELGKTEELLLLDADATEGFVPWAELPLTDAAPAAPYRARLDEAERAQRDRAFEDLELAHHLATVWSPDPALALAPLAEGVAWVQRIARDLLIRLPLVGDEIAASGWIYDAPVRGLTAALDAWPAPAHARRDALVIGALALLSEGVLSGAAPEPPAALGRAWALLQGWRRAGASEPLRLAELAARLAQAARTATERGDGGLPSEALQELDALSAGGVRFAGRPGRDLLAGLVAGAAPSVPPPLRPQRTLDARWLVASSREIGVFLRAATRGLLEVPP